MQTIFFIFAIIAIGHAIGLVTIKEVSLGTSAVLLVALLFGNFGVEIPDVVRNLGTSLFVTAVGLIAGPVFFRNFKKKAYVYLFLGILIVFTGVLFTFILGRLFDIPPSLAVGMFNGALTSTPGLASALEATKGNITAGGYGIAYPFGVIGVVLFVQLFPRIIKIDMTREVEQFKVNLPRINEDGIEKRELKTLDPIGLLVFSIVLGIGALLGGLVIPLPGGMHFSLGITGGPLFAGLIIGHFRNVGNVSIRVPHHTLKVIQEFGLCLFLVSAGADAGAGFAGILQEYGGVLFFVGVLITLIPMFVAYPIAKKGFKLDTLNTLGCITGGMTSTPALGALVSRSC